jgi:hypothetical protein
MDLLKKLKMNSSDILNKNINKFNVPNEITFFLNRIFIDIYKYLIFDD